ncbi:heme-binding protein [Mucilaginibacter sp.]|uniref:GlcG/HbpS family heme-binding protein n=1 Tax=Mucilaginibacter sp. TaxID=1882438 RepID=UPI00260A6712|nr:heme-binding protein [Mucilaginibacter sp.]MDB5126228.1 heme-binding protein [Mucilaginibacter sp.]
MDITLTQSEQVLSQAKAKANEIGVPVNIAIMDTTGYLKTLQRMDDAFIGTIDVAIQKAKTAMLFRMNTEQVGEFLKPEAAAYGLENTNGGLVGFAGGMPIKQGGKIIGYIGVSGGAIPQDFSIATAGSIIE